MSAGCCHRSSRSRLFFTITHFCDFPGVLSNILKRLTKQGCWKMPEQRARKHHQDRVAETLREELGAMIEGELSDPRISFAYVSQVVINPGGKSALIYVAVD